MTQTVEERNLEDLAKATGARLKVPSQPPVTAATVEVEMPVLIEEPDGSVPEADEFTYIDEERLTANTAPWKNPKLKMTIIYVICGLAAFAIVIVMRVGLPIPQISSFSGETTTVDDNDDTTPMVSEDGAWQRHTLSRNLGPTFEEDGRDNPLVEQEKPGPDKSKQKPSKPVVAQAKAPSSPRSAPVPARQAQSARRTPQRVQSVPASKTPAPVQPRHRPVVRSQPLPKPRSVVRSQARPVSRPVAKPLPSPVAPQVNQSPQERLRAVLQATSAGMPPTAVTVAQARPQQAIQEPQPFLVSETAVIDGVPQQLINRSTQAKGVLEMGVAFTPDDSQFLQGQTLEVTLTDTGETGLPEDSRLIVELDLPQGQGQAKSAPVRLEPVAIAIANAEYPIPSDHLMITGKNGKPLVAKRAKRGFLDSLGRTVRSVAGNLNPLAVLGVDNRVLSSINPVQLQQLSNSQPSQVLYLKEQTKVEIRVMKPMSMPLMEQELLLAEEVEPGARQAIQEVSDAQF